MGVRGERLALGSGIYNTNGNFLGSEIEAIGNR